MVVTFPEHSVHGCPECQSADSFWWIWDEQHEKYFSVQPFFFHIEVGSKPWFEPLVWPANIIGCAILLLVPPSILECPVVLATTAVTVGSLASLLPWIVPASAATDSLDILGIEKHYVPNMPWGVPVSLPILMFSYLWCVYIYVCVDVCGCYIRVVFICLQWLCQMIYAHSDWNWTL